MAFGAQFMPVDQVGKSCIASSALLKSEGSIIKCIPLPFTWRAISMLKL